MPLSSDDFSLLTRILERSASWQNERDRRDFMDEALQPSPSKSNIIGQLDLSGTTHNNAVRVVSRLDQFGQDIAGREVCCLLITTLKNKVGHVEQIELDAIASRLNCPTSIEEPVKGDRPMLPPELVTMSVPFLFEIGRWAKNELNAIWKLRRQEKEVELSKVVETPKDKTVVQEIVQEYATEFGDDYIERVLKLVATKRNLYLGHIQRVDSAREEQEMGEKTKRMVEATEANAAKQKQLLLGEIKQLLESIGLSSQ